MSEWRDISTAPKDGFVSLWVPRGDHDVHDCWFPKMYWLDGEWVSLDGETVIGESAATHWMPAPSPPSQKGAVQ